MATIPPKALAAASTAAAVALLFHHWRGSNKQEVKKQWSATLPKRWYEYLKEPIQNDKIRLAMQFKLKDVNRQELGIENGLNALQLEDVNDESITLLNLIQRKDTVLYCIDFKGMYLVYCIYMYSYIINSI